MNLVTRAATAAVALTAAAGAFAAPAHAALPTKDMGTANPTTIGAVCSNPGDTGQTIKIDRTYFDASAGTWTVSNYNSTPFPLTRTITEKKSNEWKVSAGVDFPIFDLIKISFSTSYSKSSSYEVGEVVGPYDVAPGTTAVMRAGWVVSDFSGEKTQCGSDRTWHGTGQTFTATLPAERHVEVSTRENTRFD
ncbi:hypothetical protein [Corynebacterium liangguodongii]|uniref:Uncharacterized protein n=1 Tax=Corynebacterium liangguodongii TaxID=2079535 RepID=A0A2S0WDW3_9CORY|nr:hypothetical protein [Corynebacterium liangguodongii]AWB83940.1 hypothetical protein C3E79_05145 [Corynebacterium liangguodongii]PWB99079.1 hypothetical protein DF219_08795 [Corynebacterium liangguodongii]